MEDKSYDKKGLVEHDEYLEVNSTFCGDMKTSCRVYVENELRTVVMNDDALLKQLAEVASLPGVVGEVLGLPDIHHGYGFPIGSVVAFDMDDERSIIAPGGVGYDINCGVRAVKTNLSLSDIRGIEEEIAQKLFDSIPSGLDNSNYDNKIIPLTLKELNCILDGGLEYLVSTGAVSEDNLEFTESRGKLQGDSRLVSQKAKGKGMNQLGSLGSGNHYLEIQYISEIYEDEVAEVLGLKKDQIVISIHTGSRGLGHTVCQDYLDVMYKDTVGYYKGMPKESASAPISSKVSQDYQLAMGSASNFAFCNRALISEKTKEILKQFFEDFEGELIYDVCHNIAKEETYGDKRCLIHRKGASRILEPHHPDLPEKYKSIGQPVLVGGSMGTSSFLLVGDSKAPLTFRSTCHGAGRVITRKDSKLKFTYEGIMNELKDQNIVVKCGTAKGLVEEAPSCYKDIDSVVDMSQRIGVSKKVCRLKPIIVIKAKKQTKNKVGIHKNVPLNIQVPYEEYEEFLGDYLEIKLYDEIFEILESEDDFLDCDCSITEEMLFDCLIDEKSGGTEVGELLLSDEEYEDCSLIHSDNYNYLLEMYNKQKEINKRNKDILKKTVVEPLKYFGNVELLREIDVVLETIFKKKKFKRVKKGIKIFERNLKPVDNLAADEIIARRKEFKKIFTSLEFPVPQDSLLEENVKPKMDEKFIKY